MLMPQMLQMPQMLEISTLEINTRQRFEMIQT